MFNEYKKLVVKMNDEVTNTPNAKINYEFLWDMEIVMGLTCVLPMLETVHSLNKLAQNWDIFICDYVAITELCQTKLYTMYILRGCWPAVFIWSFQELFGLGARH